MLIAALELTPMEDWGQRLSDPSIADGYGPISRLSHSS
jgi:hypothetical protein